MTYIRIGGSSFSDEDIFAFVIVVLVKIYKEIECIF